MKRKNLSQSPDKETIQKFPNTLKELISFYTQEQGVEILQNITLGCNPVFSGRGNGFLAAQYTARLCRQAGIKGMVYSASELRQLSNDYFADVSSFVIFDELTMSAITEKCADKPVIHIGSYLENATNSIVLSNFSTDQMKELAWINSMTLGWLLVRQSTRQRDTSESAKLQTVRQRAQLMADGYEPYLARCRDLLKYSPRWILLGGDAQRVALQYTSFVCAKKANHLLPWVLYEDFQENYQQLIDPDAAIIHLRSGEDPEVEAMLDLSEEKGAVVVEVTEGFFAPHRSLMTANQGVDPDLLPLLACLAGNLLAISDRIE